MSREKKGKLRAWVVWCPRLGGDDAERCGIYMARSRGQAKYLSYMSASEVYDGVSLTWFFARRAPEYDGREGVDGQMPRFLHSPLARSFR